MFDVNEKKIKATEGARKFGAVIQEVAMKKNRFIIERNGDKLAAIVPIEVYEQWKRERDEFFKKIRKVSRKTKISAVEANELVRDALQNTRSNK